MAGESCERYKKDNRILVLRDVSQMGVWQDRERLGIHGILCPYTPFTSDDVDVIAGYMKGKMKHNFAEATMRDADMPPVLRGAMDELSALFRRHIGEEDVPPMCRANSLYPIEPHQHRTTLCYTFAGLGTVGVNELGRKYITPADHILVIDEHVRHMAAQRISADRPKLIILAG